MLKWKIGSERINLGVDPDNEMRIDAIEYYVVATDETGKQWMHHERHATKFEAINEVGEVVYHANRQARQECQHMIDGFKLERIVVVRGLEGWDEL